MALNFILNTTTTIRIAIKARLEMRWRILFKSMCLLSRFVPDITVGSEDEKYLTSFVAGSAVSNSILSIISHKR
ncbi:hypothetical protein T12_5847 [Trichinella patagoniensis]|uniref:Uncharacterized protein n=1 Tax=Trichinella patagoniensis TaxID=990121 RepID=A0A0V1A021_9BILA|nr:hypothetical protein T12_5847 [Trichinella patagoniensis]